MSRAILWQALPHRQNESHMAHFLKYVSQNYAKSVRNWESLYQWSVSDLGSFWQAVSEYCGIRWQKKSDKAFTAPPVGHLIGASWFEGAKLNYCENILSAFDGRSEDFAIIAYSEGDTATYITAAQLKREVHRMSETLKRYGVKKGDHVAAVLPHTYQAIVAVLATAAIGAVWSSCSPDFGAAGIYERFHQISPKVLFYAQSYVYQGKFYDCRLSMQEVVEKIECLRHVILIDSLKEQKVKLRVDSLLYEDIVSSVDADSLALVYEPMNFDDPLFTLFSSGTTGLPKCIVHGVGGTLLQHKKELMLHCDLKAGEKLLYFTTCGWMMWNWSLSSLSLGATLVTYDGSPSYPSLTRLWDILAQEQVQTFGTSPRFLSFCQSQGLHPISSHDLSYLRTILSTGAPLSVDSFHWVYEQVKKDVHLASISGGTDIISCFMLGNPLLPVCAGEIQAPGLGMAIDAYDEEARSVRDGKAELVCTKPFVSMPVSFFNDPEQRRYKEAYFSFYDTQDIWHHGDFIEWKQDGGIIVYGRSDATLNPGGVRIGTAELYRWVESQKGIADSLAVEYKQANGEGDIVLCVKLQDASEWNEAFCHRLKSLIRTHLSPRHVPKYLFLVQDIPYTRSGKKMELAVAKALRGETITNLSSMQNPQSIEEYYQLAKVL